MDEYIDARSQRVVVASNHPSNKIQLTKQTSSSQGLQVRAKGRLCGSFSWLCFPLSFVFACALSSVALSASVCLLPLSRAKARLSCLCVNIGKRLGVKNMTG